MRGFPPSIREIGEAVGLSSSSTVHSHLRSLEEKHYIRRNPSKPRSIEVVDWPLAGPEKILSIPVSNSKTESRESIDLPMELVGDNASFLYRVDSERFKTEAIMPGDLLIVNPSQAAKTGDMILTGDSRAQSAELEKYSDTTGHARQRPVLGKIVGVIRKISVG